MKIKKKRTKKRNTVQVFRDLCASLLRGTQVVFVVDGDEKCDVINAEGERVDCTRATVDALENAPHQWSAVIAVFGRTQTGEEYLQTKVINTKSRYYKRDLNSILNKEHQQLVAEFNDNHVVTAGWIASPERYEFNEKKVAEIFAKFKAWDFLAPWEVALNVIEDRESTK